MSSTRRDNRLNRVHQCVQLSAHRYLATCEGGIALIDTTARVAVSGWIDHPRPLGLDRVSDTASVFVDEDGDVWTLALTGNVLAKTQLASGATNHWIVYANSRTYWSGRSPAEWKASDGSEGSFGTHAADFVSSFGTLLYAFDKTGWLTVYDLTAAAVKTTVALAAATGGIALVELPCDSRFSYVSIRDRKVYVYEAAGASYVVTSLTPVNYVDGLPGDVPWWNQPGVVSVQPPLTFGNGFVRTDVRTGSCESDFTTLPTEFTSDYLVFEWAILGDPSGATFSFAVGDPPGPVPNGWYARIGYNSHTINGTLATASLTCQAVKYVGGALVQNTANVPAYAQWQRVGSSNNARAVISVQALAILAKALDPAFTSFALPWTTSLPFGSTATSETNVIRPSNSSTGSDSLTPACTPPAITSGLVGTFINKAGGSWNRHTGVTACPS